MPTPAIWLASKHNVFEAEDMVGAISRRRLLRGLGWTLPLACSTPSWSQDRVPRIAFVSHAPDTDTWWNTIRNALSHASQDFGVAVDYLNPADGSIARMAQLLDGLSPANYSAVVSTIADFSALAEPLRGIVRRKLPLITVNSGTEAQSEQVGALMHIGQPEFVAGREAGLYFGKPGASLVCFNHYPSNPASMERCNGFREGLGKGRMLTVKLTGTPGENQATVADVLRQNDAFDVALALGPTSAHPFLAHVHNSVAKVPTLVTFDLSSDIVGGIRSGRVAFAIDQQPYLQGYLSVGMLAEQLRGDDFSSMRMRKLVLYSLPKLHERMARYGLSLKAGEGRHINSGPGFVTKLNVDKVERFSGQFR
jgi:simple sugar transport system substrate-binding protein